MGMARRGVFAFAFLSDGQCCCHGGNFQLHVDDDGGSDRTSLKDGNELSMYMMKNHGHGIAFFFLASGIVIDSSAVKSFRIRRTLFPSR